MRMQTQPSRHIIVHIWCILPVGARLPSFPKIASAKNVVQSASAYAADPNQSIEKGCVQIGHAVSASCLCDRHGRIFPYCHPTSSTAGCCATFDEGSQNDGALRFHSRIQTKKCHPPCPTEGSAQAVRDG
ncbi:hypothetical protein BST61_g7956 [Cercospora zeina]